MSLRDRLAAVIAAQGPISVAQYMTACLHDPDFGYYATRPALGGEGDFITAPMISQMFGELVGVWIASAWALMGVIGRTPPQASGVFAWAIRPRPAARWRWSASATRSGCRTWRLWPATARSCWPPARARR